MTGKNRHDDNQDRLRREEVERAQQRAQQQRERQRGTPAPGAGATQSGKEVTTDESVREFVDRILADPPAALTKQNDIEVIHQFRVRCPQCGELPDSPYSSALDARTAQRNHWRDHRDERI